MKLTGKQIVFGAAALFLTVWAGTKPPVANRLIWKNTAVGVTINKVEVEDDRVSITWAYEDFCENDTLTIAFADKADKDNDSAFVTYYEGPIYGNGERLMDVRWGSWGGIVENATNKACRIASYYIPPIVVHTNGVYHLDVRHAMDENFEVNTNKVIAPIGFERN